MLRWVPPEGQGPGVLRAGNLGDMTSPYEDDEPLLPDQTRDDDPRTWGDNDFGSDDDDRILREVPPHHG